VSGERKEEKGKRGREAYKVLDVAEDLIDLADLRLVLQEDVGVELGYLAIEGVLAEELALRSVNERANLNDGGRRPVVPALERATTTAARTTTTTERHRRQQ
jgi:hypothetical protein